MPSFRAVKGMDSMNTKLLLIGSIVFLVLALKTKDTILFSFFFVHLL
jgi:hypothetical protein